MLRLLGGASAAYDAKNDALAANVVIALKALCIVGPMSECRGLSTPRIGGTRRLDLLAR